MCNFQEAKKCFKIALQFGYENSNCFFNLGLAYGMLKETNTALIYFEKALEMNPNDEDCIKAIQMLRTSLKEAPAKETLPKGQVGIDLDLKKISKKKVIPVIFYKKGTGFTVYIYIIDNQDNITENFIESIDCKRENTIKYTKIKEKLMQKYNTEKIVNY